MVDEPKLRLIKDYLMNSTVDESYYNAWSEGFLCGLVKMKGWGITMEEYEDLNIWLQERKTSLKKGTEKKNGNN
jgi:hypothetical protein